MIYTKDHKTRDMFDPFPFLGPKRKQRIEGSWAKVFREHILPSLPVEKVFSKHDPAMGAPTKELYAMLGLMCISHELCLQVETPDLCPSANSGASSGTGAG